MTGAPSPPLYPDLITLVPDAQDAQYGAISQIAHTRKSWSVKDSYATLNLSASGATILFDAQWQQRAHESGPPPEDVLPVRGEAELEEWEAGWRANPALGQVFHPALLQDSNAMFLAMREDGVVIAGTALYSARGVCGLTNVFGAPKHMQRVIAAAARNAAGWPLVNYARNILPQFIPLGSLRIWVHGGADRA